MDKPTPPNLASGPAVLRATIQITRKATGKVEEYTLIGTPVPAPVPMHPPKEA